MVSARELTLSELRELRANIPEDLEIETFIHGAMLRNMLNHTEILGVKNIRPSLIFINRKILSRPRLLHHRIFPAAGMCTCPLIRISPRNFSLEEMKEGIAFAHKYGVKVYVTANILAHNRDLKGVRTYFQELKEVCPDALIIADPGVFMLAKEICPEIERHISTQACVISLLHTQSHSIPQGKNRSNQLRIVLQLIQIFPHPAVNGPVPDPELLIPASSLEVLKVAVIFGADAVYIGGEAFGLRAKAKNFSLEEMKEGIQSDLRPAEHYPTTKVPPAPKSAAHREGNEYTAPWPHP